MQSDETTEQIGRLLERATRLLEDVEDARAERTRRRAHELRQTVGVLLILTERLARECGNARWSSWTPAPAGQASPSTSTTLNPLPDS